VIVVGNLTVGGAGKTPLVIWLCEHLQRAGHRPGVVSRGYGGRPPRLPLSVTAATAPSEAGDEPVLIAARTGCPVVVDPDRPRAARALLAANDVDVIVADDGLQHYALARNLEIVVVDGRRRFGNGFCLPAGPLREPLSRLVTVDLVVVNGAGGAGEFALRLVGDRLANLADVAHTEPLTAWRGRRVHAVAGIGDPARFFTALTTAGLEVVEHPFPDHHAYRPDDLDFGDGLPVLMTEKDAVKCRTFAAARHWYLPVSAAPDAAFMAALDAKLSTLPWR
jgi:tetraacyldisaccharide 4'-kinase